MKKKYVLSKNNLTLINEDSVVTITNEHPEYSKILEEARKGDLGDWDLIKSLLDIKATIKDFLGDGLSIKDDIFSYKFRGKEIELENHGLVVKILEGFKEGRDVQTYINFLNNLVKNPLKTAINELYLFLEANDIEITEDGCFLAYKLVRGDFKDIYTGTFDNSVGKEVRIPRKSVDFNRERTCSYGLHFCSKGYLPHYGGSSSIVIIVKVNPKDVVSIPSDYNNAKGRCCGYTVEAVANTRDLDSLKEFRQEQELQGNLFQQESESDSEKIYKKLPNFNSVEEARKLFKPRVVGNRCTITRPNGEVRTYKFVGGIANKNLVRV